MCDLCKGTLIVPEQRPRPVWGHGAGYAERVRPYRPEQPCPACLSLPATDELRVFAKEWMGEWPQPKAWSRYRAATLFEGRRRDSGFDPVVPLYLPAGMDLGVRCLAHRLALDDSPVVPTTSPPWLRQGRAVWSIDVQSSTHPDGFWFGSEDTGTPEDPSVDVVVPALATIPDSPYAAQRALKLCIEATS